MQCIRQNIVQRSTIKIHNRFPQFFPSPLSPPPNPHFTPHRFLRMFPLTKTIFILHCWRKKEKKRFWIFYFLKILYNFLFYFLCCNFCINFVSCFYSESESTTRRIFDSVWRVSGWMTAPLVDGCDEFLVCIALRVRPKQKRRRKKNHKIFAKYFALFAHLLLGW